MKYYYLLNGKIMSANKRLPYKPHYIISGDNYNEDLFNSDYNNWLNSLQPCEINPNEIGKISDYKKNIFILGNTNWDEKVNEYLSKPIEVTDIISDNNGVITFKEHPKQVEEIEAVDSLLNTFGQYCTLKGIKLTDSNKVGQAVIDFLKSDIYEIFKNQK